MNRKNLGRFSIPGKDVGNDPQKIASILGKMQFVPVRVEHHWSSCCFEYEGLSPLFKRLDDGEMTPRYVLVLTENEDGSIASIEVQKT